MKNYKVTVIITPDSEGEGYSVFFPLFPSCNTCGDTIEEALHNAQESLELLFEAPGPDDLERLELSHHAYTVIGEIEVRVPPPPVEPSPEAAALLQPTTAD